MGHLRHFVQNSIDLHSKHLSQTLLIFDVRELRLSFAATLLQKVHEKQHDKIQVTEFLSLKNSPFRSLLTFVLSLHLTQKPLSDRFDKLELVFWSQAEHSNCHLYCFCVLAGRGTKEEAPLHRWDL